MTTTCQTGPLNELRPGKDVVRSLVSLLRSQSRDGSRTLPGRLPTFLIIGGMKAGTTSLYHYVRDHPQVFMPPFKALEFFAGGAHWNRGIDWYRAQFAAAPPDAVALGEASNVYTKYPRYADVPKRIHAYMPEARLVYVIRDPVERIRSHYQTREAEGTEHAPFAEAVFENPIYLDYSRYAHQIDQYLEYFPLEQLLVITSEGLRSTRGATMARVYEFLGIDEAFVSPNLDRDFYETKDRAARSPIPVWLRKSLKKHFPAAKRAKELENNLLRTLRGLRPSSEGARRQARSLAIPAELRERLVDALADDVQRLRNLLGPEFDGWGIA